LLAGTMSSLLKDIYSPEFYDRLGGVLNDTLDNFDQDQFIRQIFSPAFESMALKQRMSHSINVIGEYLPDDFEQAAAKICLLIDNLRAAGVSEESFEYMFLPEYVETRGLEHFQASVDCFEFITQFTSCEFAVRPFIQHYGQQMLERMIDWSHHQNYWVRRLASEGSRPRLPWAMALPALQQDPAPLLPILDNLKNDSHDTVRRSVANNLNDISKDNPEFVIKIAELWLGQSKDIDALLKHACRTLFKQGEPRVMAMFGFRGEGLSMDAFTLETPNVEFGKHLEFSFSIRNKRASAASLRLEYAIYLLKKNGSLSKKVFKISERVSDAGDTIRVNKKHHFKPITTRVYYAGKHQLSIIVNGRESEIIDFNLTL
jgi:3-methyladenine DNA glycosylase AlkC